MDGIWYRGILCVVCVYHLLEYVCTLCHFTDDGDGNSADRAYHKDESGDGVWNLSLIHIWFILPDGHIRMIIMPGSKHGPMVNGIFLEPVNRNPS